MKSTLAVLLATTAVIGALGLPALAAMRASSSTPAICTSDVCAAVLGDSGPPIPLIRVSGDDDDNDDSVRIRRGDDDDDDEDCDDDDDGDDGCIGALRNPAPAGTVAPPTNGLFGNGAPPVAVTN